MVAVALSQWVALITQSLLHDKIVVNAYDVLSSLGSICRHCCYDVTVIFIRPHPLTELSVFSCSSAVYIASRTNMGDLVRYYSSHPLYTVSQKNSLLLCVSSSSLD